MNRLVNQAVIKAVSAAYPLLRSHSQPSVFMWHHGRCGSTVLGRLLDQHPEIRWHGEIYEPYRVKGRSRPDFRDDLKYVLTVTGRRRAGIEIKGAPCQHLESLGLSLQEFITILRDEYGFADCIFLHRRNILFKLISVQIIYQRLMQSWHVSANSKAELKGRLRIDVQRVGDQGIRGPLLDVIQYFDEETEKARRVLEDSFDVLPLFYEEHIQSDPLEAYRKVCQHLGLSEFPAQVTTKRINTKTLRELVENASEIEDLLAGTRYEWMLSATAKGAARGATSL